MHRLQWFDRGRRIEFPLMLTEFRSSLQTLVCLIQIDLHSIQNQVMVLGWQLPPHAHVPASAADRFPCEPAVQFRCRAADSGNSIERTHLIQSSAPSKTFARRSLRLREAGTVKNRIGPTSLLQTHDTRRTRVRPGQLASYCCSVTAGMIDRVAGVSSYRSPTPATHSNVNDRLLTQFVSRSGISDILRDPNAAQVSSFVVVVLVDEFRSGSFQLTVILQHRVTLGVPVFPLFRIHTK